MSSVAEGSFAGKDRFYGNLAAVRQGKHIVVALGTVDEESATKQVAQLVGNIK